MHTPASSRPSPGVAAGHPATARAGLEVLADGGSAADAAVAAVLASCVAETVMTGLGGGGFAVHAEAATGAVTLVDFFVTVPGLGAPDGREGTLLTVDISFDRQVVPYVVGPASAGVPGVPAGCEALWRRWGRLPWARLVAPARALATGAVPLPPSHARVLAMLAPVLTLDAGAGIYAPGGRLLGGGDPLRQPGLVAALDLLADEGAATFYRGTIAERLLALVAERGGLVTADDLAAYRPLVSEPAATRYAGTTVRTRTGLADVLPTLDRLAPLRDATPVARARALVRALAPHGSTPEHTTNLVAVDRDGDVCVVTTSLGLGSGDYLPGLDLHLNSMLGETDLIRGDPVPGERMGSMMAPTVVTDGDGIVLAGGAAGGSRIRSALVQVLAGVLDEGLDPVAAVERPRLHPLGDVVHVEPGFDEEAAAALAADGRDVHRWTTRHHYFGGVSLVARAGGAADPRRDGLALVLGEHDRGEEGWVDQASAEARARGG